MKSIETAELMSPFSDLSTYLRHLKSCEGEESFKKLIPLLTTNESYFFRNEADFDLLEQVVLPERIASASDSDQSIRVWSAGCATGEEAYSIAIVLRRLLPDSSDWQIEIIGSDIDASVVEVARRGHYQQWSFRGLSDAVLEEAFEARADAFQIKEVYRSLVHFQVDNLVDATDPVARQLGQCYDIIFCRNVSLYFSDQMILRLSETFHDLLKPGGYLFVGCGEHSAEVYRQFETRVFPGAIVYQKKEPPLMTRRRKAEQGLRPRFQKNDEQKRAKDSVVPFETQSKMLLDLIAESCIQKPELSITSSSAESTTEKAPLFAEAMQLYFAKNVDQARRVFLRLLDVHSNHTESCWMLAHIAASVGDLVQAKMWSQRCLKIDPLFKEAYYTLSVIAMSEDALGEAATLIQKALYIDANFALGHFVLGSALQLMKRPEDAALSFERVWGILGHREQAALISENEFLTVGLLMQSFGKERNKL